MMDTNESLPEPVANAILSTVTQLKRKEDWVPPVRGAVMAGLPRLIGLTLNAQRELHPESAAAQAVRQGVLRILAYLSADIRVVTLIRIAGENPTALDDLLIGRIDENHRAYRYNIMTSLGIFARHGLMNEVVTDERVARVSSSLDRVRARLQGK